MVGFIEYEYGPAASVFIMNSICGPNGNQLWPIDLDLGIGCRTCLIYPRFPSDLYLNGRIGLEINHPGIRMLETRIDITDDDGFFITQVEDRRRT